MSREPTSLQFSVVQIVTNWCPSTKDSICLPAMLGLYFERRPMILSAMMDLKYGGKADSQSWDCFRYRFGDPTISPGTVPAARSTIPQPAQPSKEAQAAFPHCPHHCFRGAETVAMWRHALSSAYGLSASTSTSEAAAASTYISSLGCQQALQSIPPCTLCLLHREIPHKLGSAHRPPGCPRFLQSIQIPNDRQLVGLLAWDFRAS